MTQIIIASISSINPNLKTQINGLTTLSIRTVCNVVVWLPDLSSSLRTNLILWDAVDTHGGDGCEHHPDREQTEELAGDGVSWVLQCQPQTLPDVPITHLLEMLHVSVRMEEDNELAINSKRDKRGDVSGAVEGQNGSVVFYLFKSDISSTDVSMLLTSLSSSQLRCRLLSSLRSW